MAILGVIFALIYQLALCVVVGCLVFSIYELFKPNGERISVTQRYFWVYFPACVFVLLHNILKG